MQIKFHTERDASFTKIAHENEDMFPSFFAPPVNTLLTNRLAN